MATTGTKELRLDSTDLKWLGEKIASLEVGNFQVESAVISSNYLNARFTVKRVDKNAAEDYSGRLALVLRVPA